MTASPADLDAATDALFANQAGARFDDHTRECCWHMVMSVSENDALSGFVRSTEDTVEQAAELLDVLCTC